MALETPFRVQAGVWADRRLQLAFIHVLTRNLITSYLVALGAYATWSARGIVAASTTFHCAT